MWTLMVSGFFVDASLMVLVSCRLKVDGFSMLLESNLWLLYTFAPKSLLYTYVCRGVGRSFSRVVHGFKGDFFKKVFISNTLYGKCI